jgi:taurine dioxygenase
LLCEHQQLPEFQVRFEWEAGSIAMWDNFSTQHYAVADYYPQRRLMRRITVAGHEPKAYVSPHTMAAA